MKPCRLHLVALGFCGLLACGGRLEDRESTATGGAQSSGTGVESGGTLADSGGSASSGGSTSSIDALADCASWPREQLLPFMGPLFYGPDPGPCSSTYDLGSTQRTYEYNAAGQLTSFVISNVSAPNFEVVRGDGLVAKVTQRDDSGDIAYEWTYEWVEHSVTESRYGFLTVYELSDNGYPIALTQTSVEDPNYLAIGTYEYEGCYLTERRLEFLGGAEGPNAELLYAYDDAGHLVSSTSVLDDWTEYYDYTCWN